jgi:hypothetical protein
MEGGIEMKLYFAAAVLAVVLIATLIMVPKVAFASPNFFGPIVSGTVPYWHVPNIQYNWPSLAYPFTFPGHGSPQYPYVAGYMYTSGYSTCRSVSVTVSFPNTPDASVIGKGNWLAAGLFIDGQGGIDGEDYGFYSVVVLDNNSNLWFDIGEWVDKEFNPYIYLEWGGSLATYLGWNGPSRTLDFNETYLIQGVNRATPITLTMAWDSSGSKIVHWYATIAGVTYPSRGNSFNVGAVHPSINPGFYFGRSQIDAHTTQWWAYYFQFGIMSPQPIARSGWQVQLENPLCNGNTLTQANSVEGGNAYFDTTYQWGSSDYPNVGISSFGFGNYHYAIFKYTAGTAEGNDKILWGPIIL